MHVCWIKFYIPERKSPICPEPDDMCLAQYGTYTKDLSPSRLFSSAFQVMIANNLLNVCYVPSNVLRILYLELLVSY